jgi:Putative zinc-finger
MNCRRNQELLSDYLEDTLSPVLKRELEGHLGACDECRGLAESMKEVLSILSGFQEPEPKANLGALILARTRPALVAAREARSTVDAEPSFWRSFGSGLAAAAVLAAVLVFRPPEFLEDWSRTVSRSAHQGYSFGVRTYHRTARWIEDLNALRMTVGVAFENRLDRLNERLRDLEELRRRSGGEEEPRSDLPARPGGNAAVSKSYQARSLS